MKKSISPTDPQRLLSLEMRRERLIEANSRKGYIHSEKADRYLMCLLYLRQQIANRQAENRKANENQPWRKALMATKGLSGFQILTLNK